MIPERADIREALARRSGDVSPAFRARLAKALQEGLPRRDYRPALAVAAAVVLAVATVGGLLASRLIGHNTSGPAVASAPRVAPVTSATGPRAVSPAPTAAPTPIPMPTWVALSPASDKVVWALVANSALFRSVDQGTTWERTSLPSIDNYWRPPEISFISDQEGWLLAAGQPASQCSAQAVWILHTSDGAGSWSLLGSNAASFGPPGGGSSAIAPDYCKQDLTFVDASHGFLSGYNQYGPPVIYRTNDGGRTWAASARLPDPPPDQITPGIGSSLKPGRVSRIGTTLFVDAHGWQHTYVYRSQDGGVSWSYLATLAGANDGAQVTFLDASTWWVSGGAGFGQAITHDGGRTWEPAPASASTAAGVPPTVVFHGRSVGYSTVRGVILRTDDGGQHWTGIKTPGT